jgi:galactose-1-phosphate uridylyltransferase
MKSYELIDGKLVIRDPEIIQKLDHLSEEELKEVAEIMRKDLDEMKNNPEKSNA